MRGVLRLPSTAPISGSYLATISQILAGNPYLILLLSSRNTPPVTPLLVEQPQLS
jgi:hypothetical protein